MFGALNALIGSSRISPPCQARLERKNDDGSIKKFAKETGIECDPPSGKDVRGLFSGKGAKAALKFLSSWRADVIAHGAETATPVSDIKVGGVVRDYFKHRHHRNPLGACASALPSSARSPRPLPFQPCFGAD